VLVHQLLVMTLQFGAVSADACWEQLSVVPDFSGITRAEFDALIAHMLRQDYLFDAGGQLSMGQVAEKVFGKKNFMTLYAVFSSPVLYRVQSTGGRDVGSLEQDFVDRLVEGSTSFLLAGRAWMVERVSHEDRVIKVREAPGGQKPSWGGFLPQMLGFALCQRIRQVLADSGAYPYADAATLSAIAERRADLGELLRRPGPSVQMDGPSARWWTFAGGRINHTLKHGLEWSEGWKVVPDNFQLRIEGDGVSHRSVRAAIGKLAGAGFWEAPEARRGIMARIPPYRLSKFQDALPEAMATEMLAAYILDFEGASAHLAGMVGG
jgi:ATP-dependent helicase Lhr and Lhr-like helicase